jgi:hypothetical protein
MVRSDSDDEGDEEDGLNMEEFGLEESEGEEGL